eukprot:gnl/MRDRNA2_/MRDRNA2_55649_c0_seq1.p1 gnl/MRDRNA2_/MRDRNA2_55649_c0~~gnl/MRDRNA2_/MRDRNA2_55649_c0_seq1.p1  ORF type:complete len:1420 (-),score=195.60 gnl/MRDRNA2_/MRDRNA2_55649_c0_seq1:47-4306(-)
MKYINFVTANPGFIAFTACLVSMSLAAPGGPAKYTYPLTVPYLPKACQCREPFLGWSTKKRRCQKGSRTTCSECDHKPGCSSINTIIGRGLRAYEGDCVYLSKVTSCHHEPDHAALSYPTDIAIDHLGNIIIADSGNNRVRVLVKEFNKMFIMAGSGEVGFSGDGGPGRKAKLRYPERLTVFMTEFQEIDEIFFSDFRNQRIRKLVFDEDQGEWIISTIVGSGTVGNGCPNVTATASEQRRRTNRRLASGPQSANSNPLEPCDPLTASLQEPRGLAMDRNGNLYIADSGNRLVRRVARHYVDIEKDRWIGKDFHTFFASGEGQKGIGLYSYDGLFLNTHFHQRKEDVNLESIYSMDINDGGDLYIQDSGANIMWVTPTRTQVKYQISGVSGRYFNHFMNHFLEHKKKPVSSGAKEKVYNGLKTWLEKEGLVALVPQRSLFVPKIVGDAYWSAGQVEQGYWCDSRTDDKDNCPPKIAQYALWNSMYGACLDITSNVYIPDFGTSVVTKITTENKRRVDVTPEPHQRTLKGCKCQKAWVAAYLEPYNRSNLEDLRSLEDVGDWPHHRCAENIELYPEFLDDPPLDAGGNVVHCYTSPIYLTTDEPFKYQATGYCGSPDQDPVPWCYVEDQSCQGENWGYCGKEGTMEIEYDSRANSSIYNSPMRGRFFSEFSESDLDKILPSLSNQSFATVNTRELDYLDESDNAFFAFSHLSHMWTCFDRKLPILSTDESEGPLRMNCWHRVTPEDPAINNTEMPVVKGSSTSGEPWTFQWRCPEILADKLTAEEMGTGRLNKECMTPIVDKTDLLQGASLRALGTSSKGVLAMLGTRPFTLPLGPDVWTGEFYRLEDCLDWCTSLTGCKAVMLRWNNTKNDWHEATCALFKDMLPYNVYEFSRWEVNYNNATLPNETGWTSWLEETRGKFGPASTATPALYSLDAYTDKERETFVSTYPGHLDGIYLPLPDENGFQALFQVRLSEWGVPLIENGVVQGEYGKIAKERCETQEMKQKPEECVKVRHCGLNENGICEFKEELFDYLLKGPVPEYTLNLKSCQELCIQTPDCYSIAFPGCFLLNRTNFRFEKPGGLESRVYVRIEKDVTVQSVLGKYKSATFKGNNAPAKESLINQATQCKVDKDTGDLLVADTWNHRIRRINELNLNCHYLTNVFSVEEILTYIQKVEAVEEYCVKAAESSAAFMDAQMQSVEERKYKLFFDNFCIFAKNGLPLGIPPSPPDFAGAPFGAISSMATLCSLCAEVEAGGEDRPGHPLCPSAARCQCRTAMMDMVYTEVFTNCPATNAYYDPWHRSMSAFMSCWVDDDPHMADYLVENSADRTVALEWLIYWKGVLNQRRLNPNVSADTALTDQVINNHIKMASDNASRTDKPAESWPWSERAANVVSSWMKLGIGADLLTMQNHHYRRMSEL